MADSPLTNAGFKLTSKTAAVINAHVIDDPRRAKTSDVQRAAELQREVNEQQAKDRP